MHLLLWPQDFSPSPEMKGSFHLWQQFLNPSDTPRGLVMSSGANEVIRGQCRQVADSQSPPGAIWNQPGMRADPVALGRGHIPTLHPGGQVSTLMLRSHHLCSLGEFCSFCSHIPQSCCLQP